MAASAPRASAFRTALVTGEMVATTVCLVVAGLLLHSLLAVLDLDKGFDAGHLITVNLRLPPARYPDTAATVRFTDSVLREAASVRGVSRVGVSNLLPLGGEGGNNDILVEGALDGMTAPVADIRTVNPEYFATLGIPILEGGTFDPADRRRRVALISALAAARLWPGETPIGKRFRVGEMSEPPIDVIGVVGDVHGASLEKSPAITVYVPYWETVRGNRTRLSIAARVDGDPRAVAGPLTTAIHRADARLAVPPPQSMDAIVDQTVAMRRFQTNLVVLFGITALLLSAVGVYGVVAYAVAQQRKEIAVRIALGAASRSIARLVLAQALRPLVLALIIGIPSALAASTAVRSMLFGVVPRDAATFMIASGVLALSAVAAALIPARRAMQVDPASALRSE